MAYGAETPKPGMHVARTFSKGSMAGFRWKLQLNIKKPLGISYVLRLVWFACSLLQLVTHVCAKCIQGRHKVHPRDEGGTPPKRADHAA